MPVGGDYSLKLLRSLRSFPGDRKGVVKVSKVKQSTKRAAFSALRDTPGSGELIKQLPKLASLAAWTEIASFRVCGKSGTAAFLDIWDADHFDGFTDMQRCVTDCRAWFSAQGFTFWGSSESTSGRINCYFRAPANGTYVCNAQLQSYPSTNLAVVECLIDDSSFGALPFNGTIIQPHVCELAAGFHHFRIRQMSGAFFFLSLTVYRIA
jgi:hypothetical protein